MRQVPSPVLALGLSALFVGTVSPRALAHGGGLRARARTPAQHAQKPAEHRAGPASHTRAFLARRDHRDALGRGLNRALERGGADRRALDGSTAKLLERLAQGIKDPAVRKHLEAAAKSSGLARAARGLRSDPWLSAHISQLGRKFRSLPVEQQNRLIKRAFGDAEALAQITAGEIARAPHDVTSIGSFLHEAVLDRLARDLDQPVPYANSLLYKASQNLRSMRDLLRLYLVKGGPLRALERRWRKHKTILHLAAAVGALDRMNGLADSRNDDATITLVRNAAAEMRRIGETPLLHEVEAVRSLMRDPAWRALFVAIDRDLRGESLSEATPVE